MIDWPRIFEQAHPVPPATEEQITTFVRTVARPLSVRELAAIQRGTANLLDGSQWPMPTRPLPESYLSFLRYSNGGWFNNGQRHLSMYGTTHVRGVLLNQALPHYMPHTLPFGSCGGALYFFDMREPAVNGEYPILVAELGAFALDPYHAPRIANSFLEACQGRYAVERVLRGRILLDATTWDTCVDLRTMLADCHERPRSLRLFAVACARRVAPLFPHPCFHEALVVAERLAEGTATEQERAEAVATCRTQLSAASYSRRVTAACSAARETVDNGHDQGAWISAMAAAAAESDAPKDSPAWLAVRAQQAALLREIVGNPHRPVVVDPAWLAHNGCVGRDLVRAAYEDRRYDVLPILADALEEAGCEDVAILTHCRGPNDHVHGCWVLDALRSAELVL